MKIQPASDIHFEFFSRRAALPLELDDILASTDADVIVLAGDISVGVEAVRWAERIMQRHGKPVVLVAGNHEFYGGEIHQTLAQLREAAERIPEVHFLEQEELVIGNARFLGATLWTDYCALGGQVRDACMREAAIFLNDHDRIKIAQEQGVRGFAPHDALALHQQTMGWLRERIAATFDGPTVVVTHHGPTPLSQPRQFALSSISSAFWSDLTPFIEPSSIDLWIYGHTHACLDSQVGQTRIVSNQRGYPDFRSGALRGHEVADYRADCVIPIGE